MKVLRGTLTFVLGMIMGVILFIAAIAGTIYVVATSIKVGQLQEKIGVQIFDEGNDITEKTLLDIGKDLYGDLQTGITNMSLNELAEKYGVTTKLDSVNGFVEAIDFSPIFDVPIKDIGNSLNVIIDNISLDDIGEVAGMDFSQYDFPVLQDNLYVGVTKAIDNILKSVDSDTMSLRQIEDNFGLTLGENKIFDLIKDSPLSSFGDLIDGMSIGDLLDTDCDLFVLNGVNDVYVKADFYEEVPAAEYASIKSGAATYASGVSESGALEYKELRFKKKIVVNAEGVEAPATDVDGNQIYVVDNATNSADFAADAENPVTYYRYIEYVRADTPFTADEYFVPAYVNHFEATAHGFAPTQDGYISLKEIFTNTALSSTLTASSDTVTIPSTVYYKSNDETPVALAAIGYGLDPEKLLSADSKLEQGFEATYLRVHTGTADAAIQAIAHTTISGLNNATDQLMSVKLSDLITIDEASSQILQSMKNKSLNELSNSIDDLVLGDVVNISSSLFVEDTEGIYVFMPTNAEYRPYQASDGDADKYSVNFTAADNGNYVQLDGKYYIYDKDNAEMNPATPLQRYDKVYVPYVSGDAYVKVAENGYYTLYIPSEHAGQTRYTKITDSADALNPDYIAATVEQINNDALTKYYWNATAKSMQTTAVAAGDTAYVKGIASSKVLQRMAETSIGDFSDAFSTLILGDVLDIEVDNFVIATATFIAANPYEDYFYFDNGLYKLANSAYRTANPDADIYMVGTKGAGNAILKKLALVKIDEISTKMDDIVDSLFLSDVIDVIGSVYVEDANGDYVYVQDGKYYTLYNAAVHDATATRYSKYVEYNESDVEIPYAVATDDQIADTSVQKYYYDSVSKTMTAYTTGNLGILYVQGEPSAKVLQRLGRTPIEQFNDTFRTLYIGDVMDISIDVYEKVADDYTALAPTEGVDYYYYSDGIFLTAYPSDATWQGEHAEDDIYIVAREGDGNAVIKRMAFIPIEEIGNKMDVVIDDMALGDVVDVTSDFYYADTNGIYVYVASGKYYTLYNAAEHDVAATRYSKYTTTDGTNTFSYIKATAQQIAAGTGLYYWDNTTKTMLAYTTGDLGTLYVQGTASSMTLQRFVNVKIGKFSDEFSNLILSDVIAIDGDVYEIATPAPGFDVAADTSDLSVTYYRNNAGNYEEVSRDYITAHPGDEYYVFNGTEKYYYYNNGIYSEADAAFIGSHTGATAFYTVASAGDSHIVIKKMAYLPVDDLGTRMTDVINDLYLSDLIDIYEYNEVRDFDGATDSEDNARWIIGKDESHTLYTDGSYYYYTFVYDSAGKYYLKDEIFIELTDAQLDEFGKTTGGISYDYTRVYTANSALGEANSTANIVAAVAAFTTNANGYGYYKDSEDVYHLNTALCTYLISRGQYDNVYYRNSSGSTEVGDIWNNYVPSGAPERLLFVKFLGEYVAYDASNPAHWDLQKYLRLTDGYNLPSAEQTGTWYFDTADNTFKEENSASSVNLAFVKTANISKGANPAYYFVKLDSEFEAMKKLGTQPETYTKQLCTTLYAADDAGTYVFYNGGYVLASTLDASQLTGLQLLRQDLGYIANLNENWLNSGTSNPLSTDKVVLLKAESAPVLLAFARNDVKISTLDQSIKMFTIGDMMNVTPDSMFDDPEIKNSKIDDLSIVFQTKLQGMTINDMLDWSNITSLGPQVLAIIGDATIEDFFASLEYSATTGSVSVNIIKLYGYATA